MKVVFGSKLLLNFYGDAVATNRPDGSIYNYLENSGTEICPLNSAVYLWNMLINPQLDKIKI